MSSKRDRYSELFIRFSQKVETWLARTIGWLLLLLVISQLLMLIPEFRAFISAVVKLEGTSVSFFATTCNLWYNVVHSRAMPAFLLNSLYELLI